MTSKEVRGIWERLLERYARFIGCQPKDTVVSLQLEASFDRQLLRNWIASNRLELLTSRVNRTTDTLLVRVRRQSVKV